MSEIAVPVHQLYDGVFCGLTLVRFFFFFGWGFSKALICLDLVTVFGNIDQYYFLLGGNDQWKAWD